MIARLWPDELKDFLQSEAAVPLLAEEKIWGCKNCNGAGTMMVFIVQGGPYSTPHAKGMAKWLELPQGAGWYSGEMKVAYCPVCKKNRRVEFLEINCGLLGPELHVTLSDFLIEGQLADKKPAHDAAAELLAMNKEPCGFVTFWGGYGRGKSHLLKAITNGFRLMGVMARYKTLADLLAEIRSGFDESRGMPVEETIGELRQLRVLCIDELSQINMTPWALETINRVIDARYNQREKLLTVLALNPHPDLLPVELHYLVSRMHQGDIVEVQGVDVREAVF